MKTKIYCILFAILATALIVGFILGTAYLLKPDDVYLFSISGFTGALLVVWYEFFKKIAKG